VTALAPAEVWRWPTASKPVVPSWAVAFKHSAATGFAAASVLCSFHPTNLGASEPAAASASRGQALRRLSHLHLSRRPGDRLHLSLRLLPLSAVW